MNGDDFPVVVHNSLHWMPSKWMTGGDECLGGDKRVRDCECETVRMRATSTSSKPF